MRRYRPDARGTRGGFTLVELLVSAALCILIMTILAMSFQVGMDTLSQLKSVAGLSEQLRAAEVVMRRDLSAIHLTDENGVPLRVSQQVVANQAWGTPKQGYFAVRQTSERRQNSRAR